MAWRRRCSPAWTDQEWNELGVLFCDKPVVTLRLSSWPRALLAPQVPHIHRRIPLLFSPPLPAPPLQSVPSPAASSSRSLRGSNNSSAVWFPCAPYELLPRSPRQPRPGVQLGGDSSILSRGDALGMGKPGKMLWDERTHSFSLSWQASAHTQAFLGRSSQ